MGMSMSSTMRASVVVLATLLVAGCGAMPTERRVIDTKSDLHEQVVRIDVTVTDRTGHTQTRPMPITIFRPNGPGPFPLAVFNHGRPTAENRASQGRSRPLAFARYMVAKGFVVIAPTRIGYWETYVPRGFDPENAGSCRDLHPEATASAASDEVLATVAYAKSLPYVDTSRWIVAGVSVGGLASIATVGRHPEGLVGGINFSGGTGGDPATHPRESCRPDRIAALYASQGATSTVPMQWLYWDGDLYWGDQAPETWFKAWQAAGGRGEMVRFDALDRDGHQGFSRDVEHWLPEVERFMGSIGYASWGNTVKPAAAIDRALKEEKPDPASQ